VTDVTQEVESWVEGILSPVPVAVGEFSTIAEVSAQIQPAPTQAVVRRYLAGGGVYQYGWELYLRCHPSDERGRIDAMGELAKVADAIDRRGYPEAPDGVTWYAHEVTARPNKFSTNEDGTEDYQMIAVLTYIERSQ